MVMKKTVDVVMLFLRLIRCLSNMSCYYFDIKKKIFSALNSLLLI